MVNALRLERWAKVAELAGDSFVLMSEHLAGWTCGSLANYVDFLVLGLIGFSVLTSPMFSMVNTTSDYKKFKFFKQLSLTSLTAARRF